MEGVMEGMMQQLLSKEFLHEPLQEIASKYPAWLEANAAGLSAEDETRYRRAPSTLPARRRCALPLARCMCHGARFRRRASPGGAGGRRAGSSWGL
jgi:hypothetical protein